MLPVNPFSNLLEEEHPIGTEIEVTLIDEKGDCRHNCINFIGKGKLKGSPDSRCRSRVDKPYGPIRQKSKIIKFDHETKENLLEGHLSGLYAG